jgi:pimeloyl-ACP methyl ester carboxylesterase
MPRSGVARGARRRGARRDPGRANRRGGDFGCVIRRTRSSRRRLRRTRRRRTHPPTARPRRPNAPVARGRRRPPIRRLRGWSDVTGRRVRRRFQRLGSRPSRDRLRPRRVRRQRRGSASPGAAAQRPGRRTGGSRSIDHLAPEVRAELGRHPDRSRPARDDPRCAEILEFGHELADDVARSVGGAQSANDACLSYLESDEQLFTYLDELPTILDHLEDLAARRTRAVWPAIPVVLLTATKGRPAEFTPRVLEVQDQLAAQCNARHQLAPDSGHYIHVEQPDLVVACVKEVAR